METYTIISLGTSCVFGIIWAVRLEGRVSGNRQVADERYAQHVQLFTEREKQSEDKFDDVKEKITEVKNQLTRIEGKLDKIAYDKMTG